MDYDAKDPGSIEMFAKRLKGHTIRELTDDEGLGGQVTVSSDKGGFGVALERIYFRIAPPNDEGVPDFNEAGLELKSCPTLRRNDRLVAKERLVLSIINYDKLADEDWPTSTFLRKNGLMLLLFYLHEDGVAVVDLRVTLVGNWRFPAEDLLIIRSDWERIKAKVRAGKAHELSEGDTLYLGACTKDACSRASRTQPFSPTKAKQRAFSLKQSYVNSVIERIRLRDEVEDLSNKVIKDPEELAQRSFEQLVEDRFQPFLHKTVDEIVEGFGLPYKRNAKDYNALLTRRILGVKDRVKEFEMADVMVRSILLETKGGLKESVSFPAFDYLELAKEDDWDTSSVKQMFERRFFFVVYQKRPDGIRELSKVMFWSMPAKDLSEVEKVWRDATDKVRKGRYDELPRISDSPVSHIRPHGRNAQDKVIAPDGSMVLKRSFWLNAKYVAEQVGAGPWSDHKQSKLPLMQKGTLNIR